MVYRKLLRRISPAGLWLAVAMIISSGFFTSALAQEGDSGPPQETVRLIFIHHSSGENWLSDEDGGLGLALAENNYYVSDTNYGWGPDAIGDRTDILDWPEWFRGESSDRYMQAIYTESESNSWYTRPQVNPGGENQIVMFKSCFPNSALEGQPDDPPSPGNDLSVSSAKYTYNDLLNYFMTRPDKLFVVVTAPPLLDPTHAANARAFNRWLVHDWLRENSYPLDNVAVFDFHNVLTHPDNHHRIQNGDIEYVDAHGDGTLYYDSDGDEHPNYEGNRKATEEFIPLLNTFYRRWVAEAPGSQPVLASPLPSPTDADPPEGEPPEGESAPAIGDIPRNGGLVDNFESGNPPGTWGWQAYWDESTSTSINCQTVDIPTHTGQGALQMQFQVAEESWATCTLGFEGQQEWHDWSGLSFYAHAAEPGVPFDVNVYGGTEANIETYLVSRETTQEMVDGWGLVEIPWGEFLRAEWEENAGTPLDPWQVVGLSIGFDGYRTPRSGEIWMDDLGLLAESTQPPQDVPPTQAGDLPEESLPDDAPPEAPGQADGGLPCPGSLALMVLFFMCAFWQHNRR